MKLFAEVKKQKRENSMQKRFLEKNVTGVFENSSSFSAFCEVVLIHVKEEYGNFVKQFQEKI